MGLESPRTPESLKATLNYLKVDSNTNQKTPVSMEFSGKSMGEIADEIGGHIASLEMGPSMEVAEDVKIKTADGQEMTFPELMKLATKS